MPKSTKKYSIWKAYKNFKPSVDVSTSIRNTNGHWKRNSDEKAIFVAIHLIKEISRLWPYCNKNAKRATKGCINTTLWIL